MYNHKMLTYCHFIHHFDTSQTIYCIFRQFNTLKERYLVFCLRRLKFPSTMSTLPKMSDSHHHVEPFMLKYAANANKTAPKIYWRTLSPHFSYVDELAKHVMQLAVTTLPFIILYTVTHQLVLRTAQRQKNRRLERAPAWSSHCLKYEGGFRQAYC